MVSKCPNEDRKYQQGVQECNGLSEIPSCFCSSFSYGHPVNESKPEVQLCPEVSRIYLTAFTSFVRKFRQSFWSFAVAVVIKICLTFLQKRSDALLCSVKHCSTLTTKLHLLVGWLTPSRVSVLQNKLPVCSAAW